jgi:hypothetical protein
VLDHYVRTELVYLWGVLEQQPELAGARRQMRTTGSVSRPSRVTGGPWWRSWVREAVASVNDLLVHDDVVVHLSPGRALQDRHAARVRRRLGALHAGGWITALELQVPGHQRATVWQLAPERFADMTVGTYPATIRAVDELIDIFSPSQHY